ncbi:hypothetical protein N9910_00230 [bacterium]|nr:hypothetical protein [Akkermansiaceae bacterium]MDB4262541.1 hypothetical protein [bacterium]MDA7518595.1 hypothetical protein [Akkermansiaceae bacterium]MDA7931423.1 hypothetical protein [Akkermansiaceae bacterium]MDB0056845.1 hypothetical protein [Akkermansiaceae bacterium]
MKNTVLVAVIGIALGFAVAWIAKPDTEAAAKSETPAVVQAPDSSAKESRITTRATSVSPREESQEKKEPRITSQVIEGDSPEFMKMLEKQQRAKFDARIARLVKELNLTPSQEAELRKLWEKKTGNLNEMMQGGGSIENAAEIAGIMSGSGIEDILEPLLTDEQKEALAALQKREFDNRVESRALKGLAKLSFLDLRPEQKDAVMETLYKEAEEKENQPNPEGAVFSVISDGLGLDINVDDLGISGMIEEQIYGGLDPQDPGAFMDKMKENQQKRIDEKVEALEPILDNDQLERYRENLESKQGGILGGFLGGFQSEQTLELEIPAQKTD